MGQSLVKNYIHLIFSNKKIDNHLSNRTMRKNSSNNLGGVLQSSRLCRRFKLETSRTMYIILCLLNKNMAFSQAIGGDQNRFLFKWDGKSARKNLVISIGRMVYGAYSVNPSEVDTVINYIKNQTFPSWEKTFQDEYRAFFEKYKVDYDERYVWGWCYPLISPLQGLVRN